MVICGLNTAVVGFDGIGFIKDIWRFSTGPNVFKSVRFFPGNSDQFSFNGGWLEGSWTVELAWIWYVRSPPGNRNEVLQPLAIHSGDRTISMLQVHVPVIFFTATRMIS